MPIMIERQRPAVSLQQLLSQQKVAGSHLRAFRKTAAASLPVASSLAAIRHNQGPRSSSQACRLPSSAPPYPLVHSGHGGVAVGGVAFSWKRSLLEARCDAHWCGKARCHHAQLQIAQVLVIAPCIGRAGQFDHLALHLLTDTLYRLSASIPMGQRESRPPFDALHTVVSHARSDRLSGTAASAAVSCPTKSRGSTITRFCSWVFKVSVSFIHGHFRLHTSTLSKS